MKRNFSVLLMALSTTLLLTFSSCKKDSATNDDSALSTEATTQTDDQSMFTNEDDAVSMDVTSVFESEPGLSGRGEGTLQIPCDATATIDTANATRSVIITFNGTNCLGNRKRTGTVTISLPAGKRWREVGTELTINVANLKITRLRDNKSITVNGTKVIKNVTGGLLRNLATLGTITHTITSSGMSVTFDNGTARTWQIAKKRDFTYNNGLVISTTGTHTDGNTSNISEWGTNRLGQAFSIQVVQPMTIRQDCNFRLTSGQIIHTKLARPITVTFGLNAQGSPTSCPGANASYYLKAEWTNAQNIVKSVILPY